MPLLPEFARLEELGKSLPSVDLNGDPLTIARVMRAGGVANEAEPSDKVRRRDIAVPGPDGRSIRIRLYQPVQTALPGVVINFHGGGWVVGTLETDDYRCQLLAESAGILVVSADYCLAPEHPFPQPLEDCLEVVRWIHDHAQSLGVERHLIALAGSSAGANLAAAAALTLHTADGSFLDAPLAFQFLAYPAVDPEGSFASWLEHADQFPLSAQSMRWFWKQYLGDQSSVDPKATPIAADNLSGLPPALIVVAELDILRDEGIAYGQALRRAGVDSSIVRVSGVPHGFLTLDPYHPVSRNVLDDAALRIAESFKALA